MFRPDPYQEVLMSQRRKSPSSTRRSARRAKENAAPLEPGQQARAPGLTLRSFQVGALPLVNQLLERIQLEEFFREYLPADDPRCEFPTAQALLGRLGGTLAATAHTAKATTRAAACCRSSPSLRGACARRRAARG